MSMSCVVLERYRERVNFILIIIRTIIYYRDYIKVFQSIQLALNKFYLLSSIHSKGLWMSTETNVVWGQGWKNESSVSMCKETDGFETSRVPKWSVFGRAAGTTIEDVV